MKDHGLLLYDSFLLHHGHSTRITWHGFKLGQPDRGDASRSLAMHLSGTVPQGHAEEVFLIANAHWESHKFELPRQEGRCWNRFVDTVLSGDNAIAEHWLSRPLEDTSHRTAARSVVVLVAGACHAPRVP